MGHRYKMCQEYGWYKDSSEPFLVKGIAVIDLDEDEISDFENNCDYYVVTQYSEYCRVPIQFLVRKADFETDKEFTEDDLRAMTIELDF